MSAGHHHHDHHHLPSKGRAFAIGIALNLGFVLIEAGFGWASGSLALLADAGHNLSDVAGLVLAWAALMAGRIGSDARHSYGWQRGSILASFINALLLLVAMGLLGWEALQRLSNPAPVGGMTIIVVAAIGMVINTATALLFMRGSAHDLNIRGAFLHMAADALVSAGVVVAGLLYLWQGWNWLDPVVSLVIALVIVIGTWGLLRESVHLLFDGVPPQVDLPAVSRSLLALPGVVALHDLHIWALSTTETALSAHLVVADDSDQQALLHCASEMLHDEHGLHHATLQLESEAFAGLCHSGACGIQARGAVEV